MMVIPEEEEATISFAEAIQEVMNLLPPEFCPRKESSETIQRPRSTLDALNPTEDKNSASLPQSLLIKDVVNVFQSLIDKKVKLEPGWVTNQSLVRELGIVMKYYPSHGQLFPTSVPKIDKDASLLDLASSGNVNFPVKSLETMECQARNMVTIKSYADLFTAAAVKALESDNSDAPMLKRLLSSIVSCLKHSSSMAMILTVELLQARREAAIERSKILRGWSGGAKVLCFLHHWGVQLILAYSWARPAILVVGKGRGGMFLFLLFLHFHSCSSFFPVPLFHLLYSLSSISFLPFSGRRHKMTLKG